MQTSPESVMFHSNSIIGIMKSVIVRRAKPSDQKWPPFECSRTNVITQKSGCRELITFHRKNLISTNLIPPEVAGFCKGCHFFRISDERTCTVTESTNEKIVEGFESIIDILVHGNLELFHEGFDLVLTQRRA